jgi:uncharacterized protein
MRVDIDMGTSTGSPAQADRPAMLDLEELLATRLLVQGNSGSGKSHLLRRLLEQSAPWVQQCVIDPEGDFVTLAEKYGHVVIDAARSEAELVRIAQRLRQHRVSAVLNLEGLEADQQMRCAAAFLNGMFEADRDHWYPVLVVVDEAQLFAPAAAGEVADDARRLSLGAMTNLMCRGRKRGLAGVIATQRLAKLAKNVAADLLVMDRRQAEMFRDLKRGHFVALGPAMSRRPLPIAIGTVETQARSTSPKLTPLPEAPAPDEARDLIFTPSPDEQRVPPRRATPSPPRPTSDILADLARVQPAEIPSDETLFPEIDEAERDARIGTILAAILDDPDAAFRTDAELYQDFLVRFRIGRVAGAAPQLSAFRRLLAVARAGVDDGVTAGEGWSDVMRMAEGLPDDLQGVFMLVAGAALTQTPCPSDATLARVYGTHSARRARRLLAYFEERDLIVLRSDFSGRRIAAFPDLGCETLPGDPAAPDDASRHSSAA